jgi:hypothetical protein
VLHAPFDRMSLEKIAKEVRLGKATVHARIQAEIAARVLPLVDEVRKMELDRLDRWLEKLDAQIQDDEAAGGCARNIEVAVKVAERRAKLLGINAPEKVEATVHEVSATDVALAELVQEAQAAAAV